jgi:membrane protease YdiL (CAAX protease family)
MDRNTKGVLVYLITAFAISWVNLGTVLLAGLSPGTRGFQLASLPAVFAPAIAAFVVRKWVTKEGFSDAGLALNVRKSWRYYLFGWFFPVVMVLLIFPLAAVLGAEVSVSLPPHIVLGLVLLPGEMLIGPLVGLAGAWGEEFGWRGYLQVRLFSDRPLLAALATGFIWGLWHTPMYLGAHLPPGELIWALLVMFTGTVLGSIILGWLRLRTGSVWPAALYHAANNSASDSATLETMLYALSGRGWNWHTASMVLQCIAVGAFCAWLVLSGQLGKKPVGEQTR